MVCPERKCIEPIALNVGNGQVSALRKFLTSAPWGHDDVQAELQAVFAADLVPTAAASAVGVVGIVDERAFAKKGDPSVGVDRQHHGRLGKEDNRQVGVFLVGVTPGGMALWDHQLSSPESWCEDTPACEERRGQGPLPQTGGFPTKPPNPPGVVPTTGG